MDKIKSMNYVNELHRNGANVCSRCPDDLFKWCANERAINCKVSGGFPEFQYTGDPLIIPDFDKYGNCPHESNKNEMGGYMLGEVVFDQCGQISVILDFYDHMQVRTNGNGVCCIGQLRKCPKHLAEKSVQKWKILHPEFVQPSKSKAMKTKPNDCQTEQIKFLDGLINELHNMKNDLFRECEQATAGMLCHEANKVFCEKYEGTQKALYQCMQILMTKAYELKTNN